MVAMLFVVAFFGGMAWQRGLDQRKRKVVLASPYGTFQKDFVTPGVPSKTFSSNIKGPVTHARASDIERSL